MPSHDDGITQRLREAAHGAPDALIEPMADLLRQHHAQGFEVIESHHRQVTTLALTQGADHLGFGTTFMILRVSLDQDDSVRGVGMEFTLNGLESVAFAIRTYLNTPDQHFPPVEKDYYDDQ